MSEPSSKDTVMKTAMIYVCGGEYTVNEIRRNAYAPHFVHAVQIQ